MADPSQAGNVSGNHPAESQISGGFYLCQVAGIKVTINYSWLIIFALVVWGLAAGYFPRYFPDASPLVYWAAGIVASILFFASILIHELSHSIVAVRSGIKIPEITLFIFGGVAHLSEEPNNPKLELKIALAGPLASIGLAGLFWVIMKAVQGVFPGIIVSIFEYLAWINLALAIFNLAPGYPLDGGRIFRALVWWKTGSVTRATKWASDMGKGFAWALMILGVLQIFGGSLVGGLWLIFIGMFLRGLAISGYQETVMKQSLDGVQVQDVMFHEVISVTPELPIEDLTQKYFLKYGHGGYPVIDNGQAVGLVNLANLKELDEDSRKAKTVRDIMIPLGPEYEIRPGESLVDALKKMTQTGVGRLLVMRGQDFIGMITKSGLLRFLEIKQVLNR